MDKHSEAQFSRLFWQMPDAVCIARYPEGRILTVNDGFCSVSGYGKDEVVGQTTTEIALWGDAIERQRLLDALVEDGQFTNIEVHFRRKDGEILFVEVSGRLLAVEGENLLLIVIRDITPRRRAEEALRASELRFSEIFRITPDSMAVTNIENGRYLDVNDTFCKTTGYAREEIIGHTSLELGIWIYPRERAAVVQKLQENQSFTEELIHIRKKNGGEILALMSGCIFKKDSPAQMITVSRDITADWKTRQALQASEEKFRNLVEYAVDGILMGDARGRLMLANPTACEMTGYSYQELQGRHLSKLFPASVLEKSPLRMDLLLAGQTVISERELLRKDGTRLPVEMSSKMMPDGTVQGFMRDLTERRKAEQALREREALYRGLFENMAQGVVYQRPDGSVSDANPAALTLLGLTEDQLLGRVPTAPGWGYVYEDGTPIPAKEHPSMVALRTGKPVRDVLMGVGTAEDRRWILVNAIPEFQAGRRNPYRVFATISDLTELKRAETALRDSESRFRALFDNTTDSVFWIHVSPEGEFRVENVNRAQEKVLKLSNAEIVGKRLSEFLPAEAAQSIEGHYRECLSSGEPTRYEEGTLLQGRQRIFETLLVPLRDPRGRIHRIVGNSREITEARRSEDALRQAQKLESLGILAGGIAHDFNNLLAAMMGNLNLAQLQLDLDSPARPLLENVEQILLRAADLTKQMLAYSGKGRFVVLPHDLNAIVRDMVQLLKVSIPKKVTLQYDLGPGLPPIEGDVAQLQQVVMNLVTNAAEAIPDEGSINISTSLEFIDDECIASRLPEQGLAPGPFVKLEVVDSGCGISSEVLPRIFDPFFTTKRSGRGLGLSAMLGILKSHGGGLHIESEEGKGSCFSLYFPAKPSLPLPESEQKPASRTEALQGHVLLVEDEPVVRESTAQMLEMVGLTVTQAVDGLDAVNRFPDLKGHIDLVVMDLSMPRMDGREAFLHLRRIQPDLPIILCSGFSEGESLQASLDGRLSGFLQKPFRMAELVKAIRQIL